MTQKRPHRGKVLADAYKKSDLSIAQLTRRAGYSRGSYYNHIVQQDLSYAILLSYGKALGYDFSIDLPEMIPHIITEPDPDYLSVDDLRKEREMYKNKYMALLEKYQDLIERNNEKKE